MAKKWFYIIKDPFGGPDHKIGITANPRVRVAAYQNAFSSRSHVARFDMVFEGPANHIDKLERALKEQFNMEIESDKAGHSEWVCDTPFEAIVAAVEECIAGNRFHIAKLNAPMPVLYTDLDNILGDQYGTFK
jgi:D-tyrosyl-tRNA(Tyr) deacylase